MKHIEGTILYAIDSLVGPTTQPEHRLVHDKANVRFALVLLDKEPICVSVNWAGEITWASMGPANDSTYWFAEDDVLNPSRDTSVLFTPRGCAHSLVDFGASVRCERCGEMWDTVEKHFGLSPDPEHLPIELDDSDIYDEYDPGPECDDEGGMSEYRHYFQEDW